MGLRILLFVIITLNLTDNVIGAWLYEHIRGSAVAAQILYLKYAVVAVVFLGFCIDLAYGMKLRRYEWYGMIYLAFAIAFALLLTLTHPEYSAAGRLYLYIFPIVLYFSGMFFGSRANFGVAYLVQSYLFFYLGMALVFALLNIAVGPIPLWRDYLNYSGFILDVKGFTDDVIDGLHGNFFYSFQGIQIPRFLGSFGDPLALSYSGMILLVPVYYVLPRYRAVLCSLIVAIVAASFTRAVFLFLPIGIGIFWLFRERGFGITLLMAFAGVVLILFAGDVIAAFSDNSSTSGHVLSISLVFDFLNPATLLTGALLGGKLPEFEPGFFNVLFLFGAGPFVLLLLFMRGIYIRNATAGSATPYIAIVILVGVLTLSVISSVYFATTSAWFIWFLAGFASKRSILLIPDHGDRASVGATPDTIPAGMAGQGLPA